MKKIRTYIVEDDYKELNLLKLYLKENCPSIEIVGESGNMEDSFQEIIQLQPALLFLDIEIMGGTGYTLLDQLQKAKLGFNFQVIFMTAHQSYEYATQAFDYAALDFLSKPICAERLKTAVERSIEKVDEIQNHKQIELFTQLLQSKDILPDRIAVFLIKNEFEVVAIKDIMYIENDGNMSIFTLSDNSILKSVRNVYRYENLLVPHQFFLIREGIIINSLYLKRYKHSEKEVSMKNGKKFTASKKGGQDLKDYWINEGDNSIFGSLKRLLG